MNTRHMVVIDPIAYCGGSKIATDNLLASLGSEQLTVTIITNDKSSWSLRGYQFATLIELPILADKEQGVSYFLRYLVLAISIIAARWQYGKIDVALGASGPGVDLSLYLLQFLLGYSIIQLVHGPVACSNTIARCLVRAKCIFYLKSTLPSIKCCLQKLLSQQQIATFVNGDRFLELNNGLSDASWPSQCQYRAPKIMWAASLLKWKGLDLFIQAMATIAEEQRPNTEICFIRPQSTKQQISHAPIQLNNITWHEKPPHLDSIRANCNIFVSTSIKEPFGLSILEAMAAGHCIVIPDDNAYWAQQLQHDVSCIKYQQGNAFDLANKLTELGDNIGQIKKIGRNAQAIASRYRATQQYAPAQRVVLTMLAPLYKEKTNAQ